MTEQSVRTATVKDIFQGIKDGTLNLNDFQYYMDIVTTRVAAQAYADVRAAEDLGMDYY